MRASAIYVRIADGGADDWSARDATTARPRNRSALVLLTIMPGCPKDAAPSEDGDASHRSDDANDAK
jgi:hypothetical protein